MDDTDIEVRLPVFAAMQALDALNGRIAALYEQQTAIVIMAGKLGRDHKGFEWGVLEAAIAAAESARTRLEDALYAEALT